MNIIDIQDQLKNFSEDQLINEMQMPSGNAPQFLVLSEIQRRKRMRDDFAKRQAAQQATVAEEAIAAAGVPQSWVEACISILGMFKLGIGLHGAGHHPSSTYSCSAHPSRSYCTFSPR